MRISLDWLSQYVDLDASHSDLAERLTAIGFAVEGTDTLEGDVVFDLEINPNRVDCMNHIGVARELAAAFDRPLRLPAAGLETSVTPEQSADVSVEVEDGSDCPRYVALAVRGVKVGPSPDWLARRLEAVGLRPINNIVDITNFVLLETGQPLHAFDLDKLVDSRVVVRRARHGESLQTLDGVDRKLDGEMLVIADSEAPIALAGVMGGAHTEVSESTRNVLIESAHFAPRAVRQTAKRLAMHTDASHRFERGSDVENCLWAARRAADLMTSDAGGRAGESAVDRRAAASPSASGVLVLDEFERFAGGRIDGELIERVFPALGFELTSVGDRAWRVGVPSWRLFDVETDSRGEVYPAHFYEEALRFHGYESIEATLPRVEGPDAGSSASHERRESLRILLAAAGLAETITYGFYDDASDGVFSGVGGSDRALRLTNALSEQYRLMRRSLLPGLVAGACFNLNRGQEAVRLFEIGHVFPGGEREELELAGVVMGGELGTPWTRNKTIDLFDVKGLIETMAERAGVDLEFLPSDLQGFVAGTASEIRTAEASDVVGYLGQVTATDVSVGLFAAELSTSVLGEAGRIRVQVPSRFPGVRVDLTLTHVVELPWSRIVSAIEASRPVDMMSFELKDRYSGKGVPEGCVNTTLTFFYNSATRSLTRDEVNEQHESLAAKLRGQFTEEA